VSDSYWTRWQCRRIFHGVSSTLPCQWLPRSGRTLLYPWSPSLLGCEAMRFGRIHKFIRNLLPLPWGQQSELAASNFKVERTLLPWRWRQQVCIKFNILPNYMVSHPRTPKSWVNTVRTSNHSLIHYIFNYLSCRHKYCMDVQSLIIWQILAHEICFVSITVKELK